MLRMLQLLALDQHRCRCAVAALCACVRVPRLSVCSFSRATGRFAIFLGDLTAILGLVVDYSLRYVQKSARREYLLEHAVMRAMNVVRCGSLCGGEKIEMRRDCT